MDKSVFRGRGHLIPSNDRVYWELLGRLLVCNTLLAAIGVRLAGVWWLLPAVIALNTCAVLVVTSAMLRRRPRG